MKLNFLKHNKGASVILENVFIILFGILLLVLTVVVFTSVRDSSVDFISKAQYENVANYVLSGITIASRNMRISDYGRIFLELPDNIGGATYRISIFNNTTINVTDAQNVKSAFVQIFNVNATILGNTTTTGGGRVFLEYNRTAGTIILKAEERVISG